MDKTDRIRIVMIIQSYLPRLGGAEKQLSAVCEILRKKGFDPRIVTRRYEGMNRFEVINGTPVYRVPAPLPKPLAAFCFLFFGVIKVIQLRPDIIHAHELLSPTDLAIIAKKWLKIPLVVKVLRGGLLGDIYKLHHRKSGIIRLNRLKKNTEIFITISQEIKDELIAEGIDEGRCRFIPNGVDTSIYYSPIKEEKNEIRSNLRLPQGYLVMFCGRLALEKGLDWLLSVWGEFSHAKNATLVLVGSGEEEHKLRQLACDSVIFKGFVSNLLPYYQSADAFVLPSTTEGLSNSMLEAMACGLPIIATNVGAAREIIINGDTGLLINPHNSLELNNSLDFLYKNQEIGKRIGDQGMKYIQENYNIKKTVTLLSNLYKEILGVKVIL